MSEIPIRNEVRALKKRILYIFILWLLPVLYVAYYIVHLLVPLLQDDKFPILTMLAFSAFGIFTLIGTGFGETIEATLFYSYLLLALMGTVYLTVKK